MTSGPHNGSIRPLGFWMTRLEDLLDGFLCGVMVAGAATGVVLTVGLLVAILKR